MGNHGRKKTIESCSARVRKTWVEPSKINTGPQESLCFFVGFLFFLIAYSMSLEMSTLVTFAKTKGFVYPGSDIYGGLANSWDYGPLGSLLKENIKNLWIKNFVQKRKDMTLLDAAILMNPQVWVASGHVGGFSDPLIDDKKTGERFRADKLLEDLLEEHIKKESKQAFVDLRLIASSNELTEQNIEESSFGKKYLPLFEKLTKELVEKLNSGFQVLKLVDK
jgi:hypothetical protein